MIITNFDIYKDILKEKSGLVITPDKTYLLESRLGPVAKKWEFATLDDMAGALRGLPDAKLVNDIVEAMTTNEPSFFSALNPFNIFKDVALPYMADARKMSRKINLWCAAASSGQEPYSIALIFQEMAASLLSGWNNKILGTDISHEILDQARKGLYTQFEVQRGLPIQMLMQNFTQVEEKWQLNDNIRNMVEYKYFNLLDSMISLGKFDIVFCRNVLIYFDEEAKADILRRIAGQMEPDGFLFLGGAETVLGLETPFEAYPEKRGLYVLRDSVHLKTDETPQDQSSALA